MKTIEREIVDILLENECITELNSRDPQKIDLKSCSRTDKGVHASFNVISVKIIKEPMPELFETLRNAFAARNMMLYKLVRLTKRFMGHKCARSRIYKYILPTYFLKEGNFEEECRSQAKAAVPSEEKPRMSRVYSECELEILRGYRSEAIDRFREIMGCYVGTSNYHNFTLSRTEGNMQRYIKEIVVSEPFTSEDVEYVEITLHGQSFLLHQIRKMVSFAVLNCKYAGESFRDNMKRALSKEDVHVPKAPSQYLFLSNIFFDDLNLKREESGEEAIGVDEEKKRQFEEETIRPSVLRKENLYEWMRYFDVVRFHNDNFEILKGPKGEVSAQD